MHGASFPHLSDVSGLRELKELLAEMQLREGGKEFGKMMPDGGNIVLHLSAWEELDPDLLSPCVSAIANRTTGVGWVPTSVTIVLHGEASLVSLSRGNESPTHVTPLRM